MQQKYRLVKSVAAFQKDTATVVTIPVGAVVELVDTREGIGLLNARWAGHPIMVYEQDLAANSLMLVPQRLSPHPT